MHSALNNNNNSNHHNNLAQAEALAADLLNHMVLQAKVFPFKSSLRIDFWAKSLCEQVHLLDQATYHLHLETSFRAQGINSMLHSKAVAVSVAHLHPPTVHLRPVSVLPHLVLAPPHQVTGLLHNLNLSPVATHQAIKVISVKLYF